MSERATASVLQQMRLLLEGDAHGGKTDSQLLGEFVAERAEIAFAVLVRRHAGLVWSVCRHLLPGEHDAEDAFQATFLVLARRAGTIRKSASVGSWLYGVAYRIAMKARTNARKRQTRERQALSGTPASVPAEAAWHELQAMLDEEVERLPEKYRAPFVLCCLENRSREDAARELNCKANTLSSRIARARQLLQTRLTRRGVTLSAAMCAATLWQESAGAAIPTTLVRSASAVAGGKEGIMSTAATKLAGDAIRALAVARWTTRVLVVVALSAATGGAAVWGHAHFETPPEPPKLNVAAAPVEPESKKPTGATLMKGVYDSFAWVDTARTFRIKTEYKIKHTEEQRRWEEKQPKNPFMGYGGNQDNRRFVVKEQWAWNEKGVYKRNQSFYEGDEQVLNQQTRIWDGSLAICAESAEKNPIHFVLGNKADILFDNEDTMAYRPWGQGGAHHFWWSPTDVDKYREVRGILPEDYAIIGEEEVTGRRCHLLESKVGRSRLHIGVADGRLYRRTPYYMPGRKTPGFDYLAILQKIGGSAIKTTFHWQPWLDSLSPEERRRAWREMIVAESEFMRPSFHQDFDDYREVAPGCWMPFRQTLERHNQEASKPFVASHSEQIVTEVAVNQPLDDKLFRIELTVGLKVATDWRYDPPIHYTYRKDMTEAERVALCEAAKKERAKSEEEMEKRRAVVKSRIGTAPLALPESGWLNGEPLSWEKFRGKVVVIHFWDVNCGPCRNDLPFLATWHDRSATSDVVVIGIHPPTDNVAAVKKKLEEFGCKYPVLIDSPPAKKDGIGLMHEWFGSSWWPHTVLVNRKGLVAGHGQLWGGDIGDQMRRVGGEKELSGMP